MPLVVKTCSSCLSALVAPFVENPSQTPESANTPEGHCWAIRLLGHSSWFNTFDWRCLHGWHVSIQVLLYDYIGSILATTAPGKYLTRAQTGEVIFGGETMRFCPRQPKLIELPKWLRAGKSSDSLSFQGTHFG
jgi:hypothetical protein